MKYTGVLIALLVAACAHDPKCGGGAPAIYQEAGNCVPRIRQVVIGSDLNVPDSLKENMTGRKLEWVESSLHEGQIVLGHFVISYQESR